MENEKDTTLTAIIRGQNISVMFGLQLSLTRKLGTTLSKLTNKNCEVKYFIKKSRCVFLCASFSPATSSFCVCLIIYGVVVILHEHVYVYISIFIMWVYNRMIFFQFHVLLFCNFFYLFHVLLFCESFLFISRFTFLRIFFIYFTFYFFCDFFFH